MKGRQPAGTGHPTVTLVLLLSLATLGRPALSLAQTSRLDHSVPIGVGGALQAAAIDSTGAVSSRGAMLRSAILPGWGQFYNGHPLKGAWMAGAAGTFVYLTLRADGEVTDLAARRPEVTDPVLRTALEADIEKWRIERRRWLVWSATLWLYSVVDAFVDAQLHDFDATEPRFALGLLPLPRAGGGSTLLFTLDVTLGHRR